MSSTAELATELIANLRQTPDPAPAVPRTRRVPPGTGPAVRAPEQPSARADLLSVLRQRRSVRFYGPEPVPLPQLADVVDAGVRADREAWPAEQPSCPLETFAVAFRVDGLGPGMYLVDSPARSFTPVGPPPAADDLQGLTLQSEFCRSAVIVSIAGDLTAATQAHGSHGYRLLMGRASAAAYAMWLDAVAGGLVGSVFAGFIPAAVRTPLLSDGNSRHQLFALALGAPPPGAGLEPPATPDSERRNG